VSWWQLNDVWEQSRQEFEWSLDNEPITCPRDGEPFTLAPPTDAGADTEKFCRFCGFRFPRDWTRPQR